MLEHSMQCKIDALSNDNERLNGIVAVAVEEAVLAERAQRNKELERLRSDHATELKVVQVKLDTLSGSRDRECESLKRQVATLTSQHIQDRMAWDKERKQLLKRGSTVHRPSSAKQSLDKTDTIDASDNTTITRLSEANSRLLSALTTLSDDYEKVSQQLKAADHEMAQERRARDALVIEAKQEASKTTTNIVEELAMVRRALKIQTEAEVTLLLIPTRFYVILYCYV